MKTAEFNFELPEELIAQDPLEDRSGSRLLILDKKTGKIEHRNFRDIVDYLEKGDCLVMNDTKVIPARLIGKKENSDSKIELLLLKKKGNDVWETLVKPGKKAKVGTKIVFGDGICTAAILEIVEEGNRLVQFSYEDTFEEFLERFGEMPLPPYITHKLQNKNRYQTIYAKKEGSCAAPTAGLHFTEEILQEIKEKGVILTNITLHVGLGTFRPVKVENIKEHHMHSEFYEVQPQEAEKINKAKKDKKRVICVGTTSCRTIESAANQEGTIIAGNGNTEIFIYPGYQFKVLDGLITNFHLPQSTLLMLVSALAGKEQVLAAYQEAVEKKYRFFSFGDVMLVI